MAAIGNRRCNAASLGLMWMLADLTAPSLVQAQFFDIGSVVVPPLEARSSGERSSFARDRDVAVRDRIFPEFSAKGVPIGGLDLFPGLTIAGLATSNVFANNADRHGDLAAVIKPEATLRTRGGPVDLSIYGKAAITRFRRFHSENTEEESGGITADADVGHLSRLFGGASIGRLVLPRYASDSPFDAAKPLEYTEARAFAGGVYEPGKTRITVRVDEVRLRFHDAPRRGGGVILTKDRDRDVMSGSVRVERAIKPNMSVYLMGSGDWINYRLAPPSVPIQRDSKGWGAYVGSSFELTNLMRADVRVGYIHQKFNMPGVRPISGLGVKGKLQYFPSRLTTVTVQGERSVAGQRRARNRRLYA